jgi:hypothetical protein
MKIQLRGAPKPSVLCSSSSARFSTKLLCLLTLRQILWDRSRQPQVSESGKKYQALVRAEAFEFNWLSLSYLPTWDLKALCSDDVLAAHAIQARS